MKADAVVFCGSLAEHEPRAVCNDELAAAARLLGIDIVEYNNRDGPLPAGVEGLQKYFEDYDTVCRQQDMIG